MPFRKIGSPHPKYLAATDILISDMSNINYDFLLFDRPIILLANEWLVKNFPDLGIKTGLDGLEGAIERAIKDPDEYHENRIYWHKKTMHNPDGSSSKRVIGEIIKRSGIKEPFFVLVHGNNEVSKYHLLPLAEFLKKEGFPHEFTAFYMKKYDNLQDVVCISTHNDILKSIVHGFRVHIDHSVKGEGVTDYGELAKRFRAAGYYSNTDLHITEGEVSYNNTKKMLGPYHDRAVMVGYPKSDTLIKFNNDENKKRIYRELGFREGSILITYAPTGKYRYPFKQGASLTPEVLSGLKRISGKYGYNVLVKLRSRPSLKGRAIDMFKRFAR